MRMWTMRQWAVAGAGTAAFLALLGIPAVLIPNDLFSREIEPTWWSYPVWAATALLAGLLTATYAAPASPEGRGDAAARGGIGGGILAWFAIGCPVCNKLVLLALGTSGALTWFAPLQPVLAVTGLVLLAVALRVRLRAAVSCPLPEPRP